MSRRSHRLARLVEIITLVQSGGAWGPKALAKHFRISETRIYQDIKELSVAGVPISYTGKGYEIDEGFFLLSLNLTPEEVFLLLFPDHRSDSKPTQPARDRLRAKLLLCLPPAMRDMLNESLAHTYIKPESTTRCDDTFELIHQAVAARKRTVIDYRSLEAEDYQHRTIDPLGLAHKNHAWYVIAICRKSGQVRTFKLNRIRKVSPTGLTFRYPDGFSVKEHLAGQWGIFDGEKEDIVIRFSPLAARLVQDKPPVKDGSFIELSDGSAIFRAQVGGVREIAWWVMKYGDQAEVIRPEYLRRQVIDTLLKMSALYNIEPARALAAEKEADYGSPEPR